jgi:ribonuclease P protein component
MPARLTLGRSERLKSRKLIGQLFESGKKFNTGHFRVYYQAGDEHSGTGNCLQVGVSVSARQFRKATERNRLKRLIREAWRLQKAQLHGLLAGKGQLSVFIVFTGKEKITFDQARQEVAEVLEKLVKAVNRAS